jgi:hypothetical protein
MRAGAGYFAGQLARAAHDEHIGFAIGAKRIAPLWRLLAGIAGDGWHEAIEMGNAQVAAAGYCPDWWPADTALLIRRVALDPAQVSAGPRSRRRRALHPDQRALPIPELAGARAIYACSFILTSLDVSAPGKAAAAKHWYRHRTTVETSEPQCCHVCGSSDSCRAPSSSELVPACWLFSQGRRVCCPGGVWCGARGRPASAGSACTTVGLMSGCG